MPGRFSNLEFNDENREQDLSLDTKSSAHRDDRYYLAQATDAAHWGRFEAALRMYTRCLDANRAVVPAWVGQIQMLVELGEFHEARVWSDKALELFRGNGELLAAKAQACARLKDIPAAMSCSDGSLQTSGSSPWRWQARGEALLAAGQGYFDECFIKSLSERVRTGSTASSSAASISIIGGRATHCTTSSRRSTSTPPRATCGS